MTVRSGGGDPAVSVGVDRGDPANWGHVAPTSTHTCRVTYTLASTAPGGVTNGTAAMTFTWEAQNQ